MVAATAALGLTAPLALAAIKDGAYKGTSKGTIEVMVPDPVLFKKFVKRTDKGKVSFSVKRGAIKSFSLKGQKSMCGGQTPDVDIKLSSLRMSGDGGAGKGVYTHPALGPQTVTVKLGSKGTATGTIKYGGLCAKATATFTAKIG